MLQDASDSFVDSMSGKCAAGGRVVVVILPSSYSFLFMVDEVINISMENSLVLYTDEILLHYPICTVLQEDINSISNWAVLQLI